jgi:hypothetical protein
VTPSETANLPRWRGQPGFVEIWFLVLFDPDSETACWLRYTILSPADGSPARATVWAAWFDALSPRPAVGMKAIHPLEAWNAGDAGRFAIRIADSTLEHGRCRGAVGRLAWDLTFTPNERTAEREPALLRALPLPMQVERPNADVRFHGTITIDGMPHRLAGAPGLQTHLWGTRRVEELLWVYCPAFEEDPTARLEAASARLDRRLPGGLPAPWMTPVWWRTREGEMAPGLPRFLTDRVTRVGSTAIEIDAGSVTRAIRARAWCDPEELVGYVYREPDGRELYCAQSDIARCEAELRERRHPLESWRTVGRLTSRHAAAVEFHGPEPIPGVRYVGWDETDAGDHGKAD